MEKMTEQEKVKQSSVIRFIVGVTLMAILWCISLVYFFNDLSVMAKIIAWIIGGLFFSFLWSLDTWSDAEDKLQKAKEIDEFNAKPTQRIKRILEEKMDVCKSIMDNQANKHLQEFLLKYENSSFLADVDNEPSEIKMTNEEMYVFLQKQADFLQTMDDELINRVDQKAQKLAKRLKKKKVNFVLMEPFRQAFAKVGVTPNAIEEISGKTDEFLDIVNEAKDYTRRKLGIIGAGVEGEKRVEEELAMYDYLFRSFMNIRLEINGQSVETDCLVISKKGVFSIEVKNYAQHGNYELHLTKDGQWRKIFRNGRTEPLDKNITQQLNRHIALKQKFVHDERRKRHAEQIEFIPFHPIIVLANDTVYIENETNMPVIRTSQIYHHMMDYPDILTDEQVKEISEIIENHMLPAKEYPVMNYTDSLEETLQKFIDLDKALDAIQESLHTYTKQIVHELLEFEENVSASA
jgi:hypothetical protein